MKLIKFTLDKDIYNKHIFIDIYLHLYIGIEFCKTTKKTSFVYLFCLQ